MEAEYSVQLCAEALFYCVWLLLGHTMGRPGEVHMGLRVSSGNRLRTLSHRTREGNVVDSTLYLFPSAEEVPHAVDDIDGTRVVEQEPVVKVCPRKRCGLSYLSLCCKLTLRMKQFAEVADSPHAATLTTNQTQLLGYLRSFSTHT